jgi:hypothetical protein
LVSWSDILNGVTPEELRIKSYKNKKHVVTVRLDHDQELIKDYYFIDIVRRCRKISTMYLQVVLQDSRVYNSLKVEYTARGSRVYSKTHVGSAREVLQKRIVNKRCVRGSTTHPTPKKLNRSQS